LAPFRRSGSSFVGSIFVSGLSLKKQLINVLEAGSTTDYADLTDFTHLLGEQTNLSNLLKIGCFHLLPSD
jgi:hypothetical protein